MDKPLADIETIIGDYRSFVGDLLSRLKKISIDYASFDIDHFCYRVETNEEYTIMREKLKVVSKAFLENIHHNRPVSKFILKEPLIIGRYYISIIELPAPKLDRKYKTGLEHFEMVVGQDFNDFKKLYRGLWNGTDDSGPYNQPVYVTFENGKTVKFHERSLLEVLKLEGQRFQYLG